jgi:hypothetical protein
MIEKNNNIDLQNKPPECKICKDCKTSAPVCPYCCEPDDDWMLHNWHEKSEIEITCGGCNNKYMESKIVFIKFRTRKSQSHNTN